MLSVCYVVIGLVLPWFTFHFQVFLPLLVATVIIIKAICTSYFFIRKINSNYSKVTCDTEYEGQRLEWGFFPLSPWAVKKTNHKEEYNRTFISLTELFKQSNRQWLFIPIMVCLVIDTVSFMCKIGRQHHYRSISNGFWLISKKIIQYAPYY